ncbi:MAG TPA: polyprenyl synthetase family protein [Ruania sp.]|nr:polyprenyl synthetase family protein [Ruania sp.]
MSNVDPERWLADLRSAVAHRVHGALAESARQYQGVGVEVDDLFRVGQDLLTGGKRLRAAFVAAGWSAFGGEDLSPVIVRAGAGLELFQMAALVHDDVIDDSDTRRGRPAAHRQFAALHEEHGMLGSADRFGRSAAVLLGDLLLVAARRELEQAVTQCAAHAQAPSRRIIGDMMTEVTVGQYLDIYAQSVPWSRDPAVDLDRARRVIRSKSARYSIEHPLRLGAALAGADESGLAVCSRIGLPIGEAFQLRDDVLGVYGDPAVTGKPAGDDLREGKRTVLLTLAVLRAGAEQRDLLRRHIGDSGLQPGQVETVRSILSETGARQEVETLIEERVATGLAELASAAVAPHAAAVLRALTTAAVSRSA